MVGKINSINARRGWSTDADGVVRGSFLLITASLSWHTDVYWPGLLSARYTRDVTETTVNPKPANTLPLTTGNGVSNTVRAQVTLCGSRCINSKSQNGGGQCCVATTSDLEDPSWIRVMQVTSVKSMSCGHCLHVLTEKPITGTVDSWVFS